MLFCTYCGNQLTADACFCSRCGKPVRSQNLQPKQMTPQQSGPFSGIQKYIGTARQLPFVGNQVIEVSAQKDATNEYTRQFHLYVKSLMRDFQKEYCDYCSTFEGYIEIFADINGKYVRQVSEVAVSLLFSYGIFDYTAKDIITLFQESPAFKALDEYHENNLKLGNAYLQENYNKAVYKANRMPDQTFFGAGFGGMMLSYGLAAATGAMQEKRANKMIAKSQKLTRAQETEFFSCVKEADVMYFVWDELINIGNAVLMLLAELKPDLVDWPYEEQINKAYALLENMQNPGFPQSQLVAAAKYVLEEFPYISELYPFLINTFGYTPQIANIEQYFYDPRIRLFGQVFPEYGL